MSDIEDVSHQEARVYTYLDSETGNIDKVVIDCPQTLYVDKDGFHHIVDIANVGSVLRPGWRKITVYPRFGESPFKLDWQLFSGGPGKTIGG